MLLGDSESNSLLLKVCQFVPGAAEKYTLSLYFHHELHRS